MADEANHAGHGDAGATAQREVASLRVLIVEEDRVEGGMLAFHLRREDLVVMLAAGADEAIDALAWAPPDALLVEARGHELDGFAVVSSLGDAPVRVFLMADGPLELDDELEALRLGVSDVFTKPLDPSVVARRIRERPPATRRGSVPDLPDGGISGELAVHPVTHLLSVCHRHRMNARLHVELDGDWGVMLVRHGEVIDAESPGATGRDAAFAAIRRAAGTFVLFPLTLDAEELSRDDVVKADLATLFSEALGRPEPRPVNAARAADVAPLEVEIQRFESPRGPLSRPTGRRSAANNETLEYEAAPALLPASDRPIGPDTRARIQRQVGLPAVDPADAAPAPAAPRARVTLPLTGSAPRAGDAAVAADGPGGPGEEDAAPTAAPSESDETAAAPKGAARESGAAPAPADRSLNTQRRRVTTGAQVRERASQVRRPTRPLPVSSPPLEPVRPSARAAAEAQASGDAETVEVPVASERPRAVADRPGATDDVGPQAAATVAETEAIRAATVLPEDPGATVPIGALPPALPMSARIVRPPTASRPTPEGDFDEPTDVHDKNPMITGARVRRPTTGMFRIGDPNAPVERTDVSVDLPYDEVEAAALGRRGRPHAGALVLGGLLVALLVFIIVRVAGQPASEPVAPVAAPPAPALSSEDLAQVRFGEAAAALERGELEVAERALERLVGERDRPSGALAGLAAIYLKQGRIEDAQPLLEVLARQSDDGRVLAWLGLVNARLGRTEAARELLVEARESADGIVAERIDELLRLTP